MRVTRKIVQMSLLGVLALSLSQCKMYKNPAETREMADKALENNFDIPEYWETQPDSTEVIENWYETFNDTTLNNYVNEAVDTNNLNMVYQIALIEAQEARIRLASSKRKLQLGYGADYAGLSNSDGTNSYGGVAGSGATWEVDLWGKIKAGMLAADQDLQAAMFNYSFTRQSIAATVSNSYFTIGTLEGALTVGDSFLVLNQKIEDILKQRQSVGQTNMKDVHLATAQVNTIKNLIEAYNNDLQITTRNLEMVLGRYPSNQLKVNWSADSLTPITTISDPIGLINRRPDVKRNEYIVRSKFYLNEQARLAKYPSLVLSADLGINALGKMVFGTGAGFLGPIFTGGAINANMDIATAVQKQAAVGYGLSILNAFNEVETSMSSEKYLAQQEAYIQASINDSKEAYDIALKQFEVGRIDLFEVIQVQKQWLTKELDLVMLKGDIYKQRVQLYLALGGNITNQ